MTDLFVSVVLVVAALALGLRRDRSHRSSLGGGLLLMAWHTAWCIGYWLYSHSAVADATLYVVYGATAEVSLVPGTVFVTSLSAILVRYLGLNELNCFLAFNLPGALGLILLRAALWEASAESASTEVRLARLLVWLPGLSFWSSAPGKDALTFLGSAAAVYASLDRKARWPWLVVGVVVTFLARPHMAALMIVVAAVAHLLTERRGSRWLVAVWTLVLVAALVIPYVFTYVGLGELQGLGDLTSYVEQRQSLNMGGTTSVDISNMNVVERLLTFMFRPLFFDAPGIAGFAASVENTILLVFMAAAIPAAFRARAAMRGFLVSFNVAYAGAGWLVLAEVITNLGLATRQKAMLLPALMTTGIVAFARQRRRRPARVAQAVTALPALPRNR